MLDQSTRDRIQTDIDASDVVLFMKGTPVFPQCGFSAAVVGVLSHLGIKFKGVNVLDLLVKKLDPNRQFVRFGGEDVD